MIKQFNFYDIYGYLLPGVALLGLLWVPIGIISRSWPEQDISKALFLAALAYIAGHILQTIAIVAIPSKVLRDGENRLRLPSDRQLDKSCPDLGPDFKSRLSSQIQGKFGIDLHVAEDGDGKDDISRNRNTAFLEARSYLIVKKTAHYVEQFEGLYAMMRGMACAFLAGTLYLAGWSLAFHRDQVYLRKAIATLAVIGAAAALFASFRGLSQDLRVSKSAVRALAVSLLVIFLCAGFWAAVWQSAEFWKGAPHSSESVLWLCIVLTIVAATRCFASYRNFAIYFAQSVWRDFSVYAMVDEAAKNLDDEEIAEDS